MKATRWNGRKAVRDIQTHGRGVRFGAFAGVCAALGVAAADVAAPNVTTVGYINGTMNVVVETVAGVSHEIEMKGASDADYTVVNFKRENFDSNNIRRSCYYLSTNYLGVAAFRIRAVADGVASAWVDCGTHKATLNVTGTLVGTDGVPNRERSAAVDGRVATFIDGTVNSGNDKWVGYLYDSDVAIKAVRFLPRLDHSALASRYRDSLFQAASDVSFSDATNIYQVASNYADLSTIAEATFDPPVRARVFRHWKEKGGFEQTAELEFIPAEMPLKPALSITFSDVTNFFPVLSVTFPDRLFCSSFRIERAGRKTGPWTPLTEAWTDAAAAAPVTDQTDLYVGVPVYYRVAAVTQHPDWADETVYSEPTVYVRARRLERAWTDETQLLDGCSVMKQTNGTVIAETGRKFERAFDGNAGTFPDATKANNWSGPVGIDFGQKAWVNGFGYICRNDNGCYSRVQYAALYCASGEDPELHDKVACSANPTRYSQDTTFYYQPGTNCPSDGARCWFLYANREEDDWGRFYGNVAELMFFGWTQADIDTAPVLGQPSAPVCTRQGASVALSWRAVSHATSYTVQRRERGTDAWTTCAANLQEPAYVDDMGDVTVAAAVFEYRVVADGGKLGTDVSDETAFFYYQPGRGTGLYGAAWWPYARTSTAMEQLANVSERGAEAVDLSVPAGTELAPGVTDGVKFVWTGKLICPMTGNYTLTLDADGGGCVRVDGIDTVNDATVAPSGVFTLTAGEHTIRVEYLCTKTTDVRTCRLVWSSGSMSEEVVPASQLVPDEEMACPVVDGWDLDVLGQDRCNFTETMGGGVYKFTSGQRTWTSLTSGNYQFMSQPWMGGFDFSATVKATGYGHIGLMVRDAEGHAYYPYARNEWNTTHTGVKAIPSDAMNVKELVDPTKISSDVRPVHLRLTRTGPSFTLYTRENAADEWVEKTTWTDAGFARTTWVGIATTGWNNNFFTAEVSNIVLKPGRQPLTIILR